MTKENINSGSYNSGDRNPGNWNSGNYNSGNCNSGNYNSGNWNSGNCNSAGWNSGHYNSRYYNSGDNNSGDNNSGDNNSGDNNSGNWNSGDKNSGSCNSGSCNSGILNSNDAPLRIFNKETRLTINDIDIPCFFYFELTEWVADANMTDKEKEDNTSYKTSNGYLKTYNYKKAWQKSWDNADEKDRQKVFKLPNFDADIFYEITGIDVNKGKKVEIDYTDRPEFDLKLENVKPELHINADIIVLNGKKYQLIKE